MKKFNYSGWLLLTLVLFSTGCGGDPTLSKIKEMNSTNVFKVRSCFEAFASRHGGRSPKDQEELVAFLKTDAISKSIGGLGIDSNNVEAIFTSERDGEPLKIKWGIELNPDLPKPVAFEATGLNGVRLVAADVLLEVDNDQWYESLWNGDYEPEYLKLKKAAKGKF